MVDILTGTAFDAPRRINHREDEVALGFPSSAGSRRRYLLALKAMSWRASGGPSPWTPEPDSYVSVFGGSYIPTDILVRSDCKILWRGNLVYASTAIAAFGSLSASGIWFMATSNSRKLSWFGNGSLTCTAYNDPAPTTDGEIVFDAIGNKVTYYGNDYPYNTPSGKISDAPMWIGGANRRNDGTFISGSVGMANVRHLAYWVGGELVRDYYPRVMDGVAGLYDLVDGVFITASGPGGIEYGVGALPK